MTTSNSSTYPKTDCVKVVQAFLESGPIPRNVVAHAWKTEDRREIVSRVVQHFNTTKGQEFGVDITVRDAMQNMALEGKFANDQAQNQANMTLRKLRDRLSQIIADNETRNHSDRNDYPMYFRLHLEKGRGQWFVPVDFAYGSPCGLRLDNGMLEVFEMTGREDKTIKTFTNRARKGVK